MWGGGARSQNPRVTPPLAKNTKPPITGEMAELALAASYAVMAPVGLTYAFLFLGRGVLSPFAPLWLEARGLSGVALAVALAAPGLARLPLAPLIVIGADRFRTQRTAIILLALLCACALALMSVVSWPWLLGLCWFVASSTSVAAQPFTDVAALEATKGRGWTYGRMRAVGSIAYAVANLAGGALVRILGPFAAIAWSFCASLATAAAARTLAPTLSPPLVSGPVVLTRAFWRIAAPLGLIQGAHAFFYVYATLIWRDQGLDGARIGLLWSIAVGSEILFLALAEAARRRFGDWGLLRVSAVSGVVRWAMSGSLPDFGWQVAAQALHGLSFSTAFFAALHLLEQATPPGQVRKAQSVCAAFAGGFCVGLLTLFCGVLREDLGTSGFFVMAAVSAVALPFLAEGRSRPESAAS
mgnify:CR=1 FL=1